MSNAVFFGLMMGALVLPVAVSFLDVVLDPANEEGLVFTALSWVASAVALGITNYHAHDLFDSWVVVIYSILSVVSVAYSAVMIHYNHDAETWIP